MSSLDERAYLVTGAAAGIGAAVTNDLRAAGARVLAVDLDADDDRDSVGADLTVADENARVVGRPASASAGSTAWSPTPAFSTWRRSPSSRSRSGTGSWR